MELLVGSLIVAMILTIWFKTEAFAEYAELLGLTTFPILQNFRIIKLGDSTVKFLDYLTSYHDSFLTRLVSCPICLATWLGMAGGAILWSWSLMLPLSFLGLCFYGLLGILLKNG